MLRTSPRVLACTLALATGCSSILDVDFTATPAVSDASFDASGLADASDDAADSTGPGTDAALQFDDSGTPTVSVGFGYVCAVSTAGVVWCWGNGLHGQLGTGRSMFEVVPRQVAAVPSSTSVSASYAHSCALAKDRHVYCWGSNDEGALGLGHKGDSDKRAHLVTVIDEATYIAVGRGFSCAVNANGQVLCWGANKLGQLGRGTSSDSELDAQAVVDLQGVKRIWARESYACAQLPDSSLRCWGANRFAQLGIGSRSPEAQTRPTEPQGLGAVVDVALNGLGACALKPDGHVWCWGMNTDAQTGQGYATTDPLVAPKEVPGLVATGIASGDGHSCAHLQDGGTACWGSNTDGLLHIESNAAPVLTPSRVTNLPSPVKKLYGGGMNYCAHLMNGSFACWGLNGSGQIGNGMTSDFESVAPFVLPPL